jgi:cell division protein FtsQ
MSADGDKALISDKGLMTLVSKSFPNLKGEPLSSINTNDIELRIEKNAVVERCKVYFTPGGVMHVIAQQRNPLLRIFSGNSSFYLDDKGYRIPVYQSHSAHVLVASGNVAGAENDSALIAITKYINSSKFWNAQIEQLHVTNNREFLLVPRVGNHIIIFGGIDQMEQKFANLKALYEHGWEPHEWNCYKSVNLKYKGQIVCTKSNDI